MIDMISVPRAIILNCLLLFLPFSFANDIGFRLTDNANETQNSNENEYCFNQ